MKKQKTIKIVAAILTLLMVTMFMQTTVFAGGADMGSVVTNVQNASKETTNADAENSITKMGGQIIRIMQIVGVVVAIAMLIYLAIKYISSAPNEKAEIKNSATKYVVGAVILFAASGILGIIQQFASNLG